MTTIERIQDVSNRRLPWQANPNQIAVPRVTASEAVLLADLSYPIVKEQLLIASTGEFSDSYAVGREIDEVASYGRRTMEFVQYGTVSKDYTPIQAMELAMQLDPVTEKYPVVSIGSNDRGANIYMFLSAGTQNIAGEEHDLYFIVKDARSGRRGLSISFMPLRLACRNGLVYFNAESGASTIFHHVKSISKDVSTFSQTLLPRMMETQAEAIKQFNRMAEVKINSDEVNQIVASAYPEPRLPRSIRHLAGTSNNLMMELTQEYRNSQVEQHPDYQKYINSVRNVEDIKEAVAESYDGFNAKYGYKNLNNTAWALWNSIVEVEDHGRTNRNNSMASIVGDRTAIKAKSFRKAYELIS